MKKLVVFIMLLVLSLTCFAACNTTPADKAESLERAATYLNQMYKGEPKETPADYEVVKQVRIGERTIAVTWEVEVLTEGVPADSVKVVVNPDRSVTIDVNEETPVAIEYLLKGTVSNSINSITKTFERVIPQYIPALTPVEGEEYHFAFLQGNNNFKAYYLTGALSGFYLETSNDPTKAAKVSIENAEGGFYIVVTVNGNKTYLNTTLALKDASNPEGGYNRNFSFDATPITVYEYASEFRAVKMLLSDEANGYAVYYCLGTYSSYTTGSASELRYLSSTNVDVTQFPFHFFATDADLSVFEKVEEKPDEPVADKKVTISEFNAIAEALGENNKTTTEKYIITGTITEIKNETYGNMYIQDENGVSAYIYGLYNADGTVRFDAMDPKPAVGDTITVVGVASYYNGAQMKNAWLCEEEGEKDEIISIAEFNAIADALGENNKTTEEKYIIRGKVTEIKNTTYGNMYIEDENGDKAYLYGLYSADGSTRFDAMEVKPAVGDTITVIGVACYYNGPQMKNAWLYEAAEDDGTISLTEFNAIADALGENNKTTEEKYTIKGKVTEIKSETYGNMYIEDESGAKVYIYGIYSADGSTRYDAMEVKPAVGDTIIVTGVACYYNGPQMKNGWVLEIVGAETPDDPDTPDVPVVGAPVVGTEYYIALTQENKNNEVYYIIPGMASTYYLATSTETTNAIKFQVEATEGGYYLFYVDGSAKTYLNVVTSGTHVNSVYGSTASTVYTYDAELNTLVTPVNGEAYAIGTKSDGTYTTLGPVAVSKNPFVIYFVSVGGGEEPPVHEHDWKLVAGETTHWYECACKEVKDETAHDFTNGDCVCGAKAPAQPEEPAEGKVELTADGMGLGAYAAGSVTVNNVEISYVELGSYGNGIQMRNKTVASSLWNTTALAGGIEKLELVYNAANANYSNTNALKIEFANSADFANAYVVYLSTVKGQTTAYTVEADATTYTYVRITNNITYSMYWDSIVIYYAEETTEPEQPVVVEKTTTLTADGMGLGAYAAGEVTVDGMGISYVELGSYGNGIQMRNKTVASSLWNTTAAGNGIAKLELVYNAANANYSNANALKIEFANSADFANAYVVYLSTVKGQTTAYTVEADATTYTYVRITNNITYSMYWDSIVIYYVGEATEPEQPEHTCSFTELKSDATHHWYECECGEAGEKEEHKGGTATTTEQAKCEVCDTPYGELAQPEVPETNGGRADLETITTSYANGGDSSYTKVFTSTNGWTTANAAIQVGSTRDMNPEYICIGVGNKAVCLNGKVSAPGSLTSPTLTGGVEKIEFDWTKIFSDTNIKFTVTVTDLATNEVQTYVVTGGSEAKYQITHITWTLEKAITGDFTIVFTNNSPSANTGNKDRATIWNIAWTAPVAQAPAEPVTASKSIADLIVSEGWTNSTTKQEFALDEVVTVKVDGGSNSGKAYDGDHIRIYATDSPAGSLTISVAEGYELVSVKVTCVTGTYAFLYVGDNTTDISNVLTEVSGSSVVLNAVKNGSNGKQVRVTAIEVVYKAV